MTQQDDITQRLRDNADIDEAEHGNARVVQLEREAADEIERLRGELSKLRAPVADERAAVAYLDLGAGGYMDMGTDLTDEQLAALPKGRHMLAIIGTHGVDGYEIYRLQRAALSAPQAEQGGCDA